jgi:Ni,Fe-hydrogenase III small subunit
MSLAGLFKTLFLGPRVTEPAERLLEDRAGRAPAPAQRLTPGGGLALSSAAAELHAVLASLYGGRSLRIRAVDAGSCNAEELELMALTNAYYDIERFGLSFVASPRHADMLMVTGPVTRNLEQALRATYEAAPQPCIVVAVGDGACDGGIWRDSYAVVGPVDAVIPVHIRIPGDPPTPEQILRGLAVGLAAGGARLGGRGR